MFSLILFLLFSSVSPIILVAVFFDVFVKYFLYLVILMLSNYFECIICCLYFVVFVEAETL